MASSAKKGRASKEPGLRQEKFVLPDGARYEGEYAVLQHTPQRCGQGTCVFPDGAVYSGEWKFDLMDGQGELKFACGDVYKGTFVKGAFEGQGTYTLASGTTLSGMWSNNMLIGEGRFTDSAKVEWVGTFEDGKGGRLVPEIKP